MRARFAPPPRVNDQQIAPLTGARPPFPPTALPLAPSPTKRQPFSRGLSRLSLTLWAVLVAVALPTYSQAADQAYTQAWSQCTSGCCTTGSCTGPAETLLLPIQGLWLLLFGLASVPFLLSLRRRAS